MPMSTKRKAPGKLAAPVVKSNVKPITKSTINESRTSVAGTDAVVQNSSQAEAIEISSGSDSDEDVSDEDEGGNAEVSNGNGFADANISVAKTNGKALGKPGDDAEVADSDDEPTSPSFGELLRGSEAIDVPSLLQQSSTSGNALRRPNVGITPPSHQSLTTVLTQALRTDDTDLLESCLHVKDLDTIRNTIERIDSILAGTLLNRLASRLYRRPGRAGVLMTWIQWTLVAHGGAIASQPKVLHGLSGLQKVLAERAKGLNSLLALKGKLDMLDSQMELRRRMQRPGTIQQGDDAEEEDVIWVEGETNDDVNGIPARRKRNVDDDDDDVLAANGFIGDSEDSEDDEMADEDDEDDDDDVEDELDEDEVDHEEVDDSMAEDEESDAEPAPPAKVQKTSRAFSKK